jgi:phospholipase C
MIKFQPLVILIALAGAGCFQYEVARTPGKGLVPVARAGGSGTTRIEFPLSAVTDQRTIGNGKITHVVIIFQENRSTDNLFNGLPGADTVRFGFDSAGRRVNLRPVRLTAPYDLDHSHRAYNTEFDNGVLGGFNLELSTCKPAGRKCSEGDRRAYRFVPRKEVQPYFAMAEQYAFGDRMFQTNEGPSFPAHQYILSGTSTILKGSQLRASEGALTPSQNVAGGCDSPRGTRSMTIDDDGQEKTEVFPCFERPALTDLLEAKSLSWRYYLYARTPNVWNGPDAIRHIRESPEYSTDVVAPPSKVLTDIAAGDLASVVWVTPTGNASDHAGITDGSGPSWVASVVNAIGKSQYWNDTVIFVTWDDWGGWYDHAKPPQYNSYELGFRVPLIVISPYTKKGYVSHTQHEFGSILKFTEETFGLGSLGTTDVRSDDLSDCFAFSQKPRPFKPIPAALPPSYFSNQPVSTLNPDDDY